MIGAATTVANGVLLALGLTETPKQQRGCSRGGKPDYRNNEASTRQSNNRIAGPLVLFRTPCGLSAIHDTELSSYVALVLTVLVCL